MTAPRPFGPASVSPLRDRAPLVGYAAGDMARRQAYARELATYRRARNARWASVSGPGAASAEIRQLAADLDQGLQAIAAGCANATSSVR